MLVNIVRYLGRARYLISLGTISAVRRIIDVILTFELGVKTR